MAASNLKPFEKALWGGGLPMPIRRAKLKLKLLEHTEAGRRWFTLESGEAISGGYEDRKSVV